MSRRLLVAVAAFAWGCGVPGEAPYDPVDDQVPTLEAAVPVDGVEEVPSELRIHLVFSEPVLPASVRVRLESGRLETSAVPESGEASARMVLAPRAPLEPGLLWTARLGGEVADRHLNVLGEDVAWAFRTGAADPAFAVTEVSPADGSRGVAVDAAVNVTLSRPVHAAMLTAETIRLEEGGGRVVPVRVGLAPAAERDGVGDGLEITPTRDLSPGVRYTVAVSAGLVDVSARPLGVPFTSTFETGP